ncbi:MAG: hypothetical protein ABL927_09975, partial [Bdellovibrionales bacterium]
LLITSAFVAEAKTVYVIENKSTKAVASEISDMYLGNRLFAAALENDMIEGKIALDQVTRVVPIMNLSLKAEFLKKVLNFNENRFSNYWKKKNFKDGIAEPVEKLNDEEVLSFVKKTKGAIGYISDEPPADIVLIKKF